MTYSVWHRDNQNTSWELNFSGMTHDTATEWAAYVQKHLHPYTLVIRDDEDPNALPK